MFQFHHLNTDREEINLDEICRLCRTSKGVMSYIFSTTGVDTTLPLSTRIMSFVNIDMQEGDGLPSLICHRCLYHVEQINEFKLQCEQSDAFLRHYVSSQLDSKFVLKSGGSTVGRSTQCNGLAKENGYASDEEFQNSFEMKCVELDNENEEDSNNMLEENFEPASESDENVINCPTCNKGFELEEALNRHKFIHTQDGPFPCDYCDTIHPDKATLRVHWRQEHAGNKSHMCQTCGEAFKYRDNLLKHNIRHDKMKPYRCSEPSCNKAFSYRSDLRKHLVIHSGIRPYVCPICFKAFTRSTNLNKHARVHSGRRPFPCGDCEKMFATRGDLMRHSLIHTGEKPYSCSICCVSFNRKDKLSRHEKLHNEQRAHVCSECPTSFNRKEELTKHVQFHHFLPGPLEEDVRQKVDNSSEASAKMEEKEGQQKDKSTSETSVKLKESEQQSVETHSDHIQKTDSLTNGESLSAEEGKGDNGETEDVIISVDPSHWAETKHQCELCGKHFKDELDFKKHVASHEKSRNFICEICCKGFHQRRELVRHSLTHSGFKPFACETCGKAFSRRDKLTRHKRTHVVSRKVKTFFKEPPTCDICLKVYSSAHELTRHMLTHSFYKPYQCSHCTSSYCRKDKLVKHIKSTHSEIVADQNNPAENVGENNVVAH